MKKLFLISCISFGLISCARTKPDSTACVGSPIPDCMCTMQYDPVCGCDGKTYGNACVAKCAGVKSWTKGECNK